MIPDKSREQRGKFLQLMFQDYYRENSNKIDIPDRIWNREFGLESWDFLWKCTNPSCGRDGTSFKPVLKCPHCGHDTTITKWKRHVGFRTADDLFKELYSSAPHSVYHSAAFYETPVARMAEKGWEGAELVFDIDADHLDSPCSKNHDVWICSNAQCSEYGMGAPPTEGCPRCGENRFSTRKWVCDRCLEDARMNTIKIHDEFLVNDFNIDPKFIQINYSGHRGYHIRVRDPNIFKLDSQGRIEIIHFITGMGLDSERIIRSIGNNDVIPSRDMPGWAGKMADAILEYLRSIDEQPDDYKWAKSLMDHQRIAADGLIRNPPILSPKVTGVGLKSWQEIAKESALVYGGKTDIPVTHDIHRVIRLIGSLNGKTGFEVTRLTRDDLDTFDPFSDAIAFNEGVLKVRIASGFLPIPQIRIGNTIFGPYSDEEIELPMAAAMFLLCKEVAMIA